MDNIRLNSLDFSLYSWQVLQIAWQAFALQAIKRNLTTGRLQSFRLFLYKRGKAIPIKRANYKNPHTNPLPASLIQDQATLATHIITNHIPNQRLCLFFI